MPRYSKTQAVLERIQRLEEEITRGREYLQTGKHADWKGFQPVFYGKTRNGQPLPPHKDWVKNVFILTRERELKKAEKALEKLNDRKPQPLRRRAS